LIVRPTGLVRRGELQIGLEVEITAGVVTDIRPQTGVPDPFILSPAFVNSHSHLEYRGKQGKIAAEGYWEWLRELTQGKTAETIEEVRQWTERAAVENRRTGVALIAEHADRPVVGAAAEKAGLSGRIYQEVLTIGDKDVEAKLRWVRERADLNGRDFGGETVVNPHAYWTVDDETLASFTEGSVSIHVAESELERLCFEKGQGPMAEALARFDPEFKAPGVSTVHLLDRLGLARPGVQFVHCCDLDSGEIELLARRGVSVAHCPRSNRRLQCPIAPVREMLDAGIAVGIGMDSAASGGPIDMFQEMRAAEQASIERGKPLTPEEIWSAATWMGAQSIGYGGWDIEVGASVPLILLHVEGAQCTEDLLHAGSPDCVEWLQEQ
jgi:cytosine/adenosine deaminase-related metal-dependent hydrolase